MPPTVTLKQIHDAVPKHLLQKDPLRSTGYILRDVFFCALFFAFGAAIEPMVATHFYGFVPLTSPWQASLARALLWLTYWWWQGIVFTSFFCIGESLDRAALLLSPCACPAGSLADHVLRPHSFGTLQRTK